MLSLGEQSPTLLWNHCAEIPFSDCEQAVCGKFSRLFPPSDYEELPCSPVRKLEFVLLPGIVVASAMIIGN
jgi:hypothetical protein